MTKIRYGVALVCMAVMLMCSSAFAQGMQSVMTAESPPAVMLQVQQRPNVLTNVRTSITVARSNRIARARQVRVRQVSRRMARVAR